MLKIVALSLVFTFVILSFKGFNDRYAVLIGLASSIILIVLSSEYVEKVLSFINGLVESSGIDQGIISIIFKITGIGYLIEFSTNLIEDAGLKSISDKLVFIGKVIIIATSIPVFYAVFGTFTELFS